MNKNTEIQSELNDLGKAVANLPAENPFDIPEAYFAEFAECILLKIGEIERIKETEQLSPMLKTLQKENPFALPSDYFSQLNPAPQLSPVKRIGVFDARKVIRYAAAACLILGLGLLLHLILPPQIQPQLANLLKVENRDQFSEESVLQYFQELGDLGMLNAKDDGFAENNLLVDLTRESIEVLLSSITEQGISHYVSQQDLGGNQASYLIN